jgi:Spy/CpxP family protein refolding chaperone
MNDFDNRGETSGQGQARPARVRRWGLAGLIVLVGAVTVATGGASLAGAVQGHHMGGHAAMDPAEADRHISAMIDNLLPDGTPEQKARLATIIRSAHADIAPFHAQLRQAHQRAHMLLMQPRVDRAALESLRAEEIRQLDATSRRLVGAIADAADLLTPEQRGRLFQLMQGRMH